MPIDELQSRAMGERLIADRLSVENGLKVLGNGAERDRELVDFLTLFTFSLCRAGLCAMLAQFERALSCCRSP